MNNFDNKKSDYNRMSPKDIYTKPSINSRSLGVYEQYLKKTIENINQDLNKSTNSAANYSQSSVEANYRNNEQRMGATPKALVMADDSSDNGAKLLTIIGAFCTLLLLALVIILFSATDTLIDRISAVDSQVSEVSDNISVIGKENSLATSIAIAEEKATNAANARNLAQLKESLNSIALNAELANLKAEPQMTTRMRSMQLGESSLEPEQESLQTSADSTISYDSFKKESQQVLYRDSSY